MKTKAEHRIITINYNLHKVILLAIAGFTMSISAQAAILIQDTFNRGTVLAPLALAGSSPDIATGGQTWLVSPSATATTNGSSLSAFIGWSDSAKLAFTPSAGQVYSLSVDVSNISAGDFGIVFGFSSNTAVDGTGNIDSFAASSLIAPSGAIQEFARWGGGILAGSAGAATPGLTNLKIVLDTTAANWTVAFYTNNVEVGGSFYTYTTNPTIASIALGGGDTSATFDNFTLSAVPEPSAWAMAVGGLGILAFGRRAFRRSA